MAVVGAFAGGLVALAVVRRRRISSEGYEAIAIPDGDL